MSVCVVIALEFELGDIPRRAPRSIRLGALVTTARRSLVICCRPLNDRPYIAGRQTPNHRSRAELFFRPMRTMSTITPSLRGSTGLSRGPLPVSCSHERITDADRTRLAALFGRCTWFGVHVLDLPKLRRFGLEQI